VNSNSFKGLDECHDVIELLLGVYHGRNGTYFDEADHGEHGIINPSISLPVPV